MRISGNPQSFHCSDVLICEIVLGFSFCFASDLLFLMGGSLSLDWIHGGESGHLLSCFLMFYWRIEMDLI